MKLLASCLRIRWWGWLALLLLVPPVGAADLQTDKNRFSLRGLAAFGVKAEFENLGAFPQQSNPGAATRGVNHEYDDGYNRVDSGGNADGLTWHWGYQHQSQLSGTDTIVMHSAAGSGGGSVEAEENLPQWGMELAFTRQLGSSSSYWWAIELGVGWMDLSFSEDATFNSHVSLTTDTYALNGITAPLAPYAGTFTGPGVLISDLPSRAVTSLPGAALTTGSYSVDASLYTLRLGLLYESPFNDWLALQFGGGGLAALVDSELSYAEQSSYGSVSSQRSGTDSTSEFLGGAYAVAGLAFHLSERVVATFGAQYTYLGQFDQEVDGKQVQIDFQSCISATASVGVKF